MHEYCEIMKYRIKEKGTELLVIVPEKQIGDYIKRFAVEGKVKAELRLDDGRTISIEQRKKLYATIRDISFYTGHHPEEVKEIMKYNYMIERGEEYFSLSNCSMTTARLFINYLIEFCFQWDIPMQEHGISRTDDIGKYLWLCLKYKKCAICGKKAEVHHWDAIGMGRNRTNIDDSELRKIALCREHHTEAHKIGRDSFEKKYLVYGIIYED